MNILKLNEISPLANKALPSNFVLTKDCKNPAAIILRSFNMHDYQLPDSVLCVARAGAGVNNIPVDKCSQKGVVVFNTPGANANAVKELVICCLLLSSRKIVDGIKWTSGLKGKGAEVAKLVESGKGAFGGGEISGKTLGVIGLGAIGAMTANAAVDLGMDVIGYDPYISIEQAWMLSNSVSRAIDISEIYKSCDYITLHIPATAGNVNIIDSEAFAKMKHGVKLINLARNELVNNDCLKENLLSGKVSSYVTDFPSDDLIDVENVIAIPHLGASTNEAEDNCAFMAVKQLSDYIMTGNVVNSVNFPNSVIPRSGKCRITVVHKNVKNVLNPITESISAQKINISNMVSSSKGEYAYAIFELDDDIDGVLEQKIKAIPEVVKVRVIR